MSKLSKDLHPDRRIPRARLFQQAAIIGGSLKMSLEYSERKKQDHWFELRGLVHSVGMREIRSRFFSGDFRVLGVHRWVQLVQDFEERNAMRIDDEPDVRRRINYAADAEWIDEKIPRPMGEIPLWNHVGRINDKFYDWKPRGGHHNRDTLGYDLQSCYLPSVSAFTDEDERIKAFDYLAECVRRSKFEREHGRTQGTL